MRPQQGFIKVAAIAVTAFGVMAVPTAAMSQSAPPAVRASTLAPLTITPNPAPAPLTEAQQEIARAARAALARQPHRAFLQSSEELIVTDVIADPDGQADVRFVRLLDGVEVLGGDFVAHLGQRGRLQGVSQTLTRPVGDPARGTVGLGSALTATLTAVNELLDAVPTSRRQVILATDFGAVRAWELTILAKRLDGTPSRTVALVDMASGAILELQETVETVEGRGLTQYSGRVDLDVTRSGNGFVLTDPQRGGSRVLDANNETEGALCGITGGGCARGADVARPQARFGNGSTNDRATAAADVAYGIGVAWDYFLKVQGRRGITGRGEPVESRVHYGRNFANAFWDGTRLTFGDGDGRTFSALTSLDVAAHELAHGVTQHSANLVYSGESGGLNEATSDIFGTLVEFYARNSADPGDYFIGEEFDLSGGFGLRRMDRPSRDGRSPDCYSPAVAQMDVHFASGIANHFFYTLAEGSGVKKINNVRHRSPSCHGAKVEGIGRLAAGKIWYRALTRYMTSRTGYSQARLATLAAAQDLYGPRSEQRSAVDQAWKAAGVNG